MRKIEKFKGKIDFNNDSPAKIQKTLDNLSQYLMDFREDEAATIISQFSSSNSKPSQTDRLEREKLTKLAVARNELLADLGKTFKKISEDLVDEQKTELKGPKSEGWKSKPINAVKSIAAKSASAAKDAAAFASGPLDWLKQALFGRLFGKLASMLGKVLTSPVKMLVAGAVKALFGAGKLGFKLVKSVASTAVKTATRALFAVGGFATKLLKSAINTIWNSDIANRLKVLGSDIAEKAKNLGSKVVNGAKNIASNVSNKAKSAASKASKVAESAFSKIGDFFSKATSKVKNGTIAAFESAKSAAGKAYNKTKKLAHKAADAVISAASKISDSVKSKFSKLKSKVTSIIGKVSSFFKKGSSKAARSLASKLPLALGKAASKLVPGIGWALIAYEVYAAAKKSGSVVGFAVNLVDGLSGGLISMAGAVGLEGFDGKNLGDYVEGLLNGKSQSLLSDDEKILDDVNLDQLEANSTEILKALDSLNMSGGSDEAEKIEKSLAGNIHKNKILNEYKRLVTLKQNGAISQDRAKTQFKEFIKRLYNTEGTSEVAGVARVDQNGVEYDQNGDVEISKHSELNSETYDVETANKAAMSQVIGAATTAIAFQTATTVASNVARTTAQINHTQQLNSSSATPQTVVQGG